MVLLYWSLHIIYSATLETDLWVEVQILFPAGHPVAESAFSHVPSSLFPQIARKTELAMAGAGEGGRKDRASHSLGREGSV